MSEKNCGNCKHFEIDGMFGAWCEKGHNWEDNMGYCFDWERKIMMTKKPVWDTDLKKYDKAYVVEDDILWKVFSDGYSQAEVIFTKENICNLLNTLNEENEQLKAKVRRLQDIATRTEEEKEHYADLYNQCRRYKLSDEAIKKAYAELNRREIEKHCSGDTTFIATSHSEMMY